MSLYRRLERGGAGDILLGIESDQEIAFVSFPLHVSSFIDRLGDAESANALFEHVYCFFAMAKAS